MKGSRSRHLTQPTVQGDKPPLHTVVPSVPEVDHPGLLQLAREAEWRDRAALHRPPWIIARHREHRTRAADGRPHAAERIPELPAAHAALLGEKALVTIHVGLGAVAEDLRQWGDEVLGVAGGGAARGLRHEDAIAIVLVRRRAVLDQAIAGVKAFLPALRAAFAPVPRGHSHPRPSVRPQRAARLAQGFFLLGDMSPGG